MSRSKFPQAFNERTSDMTPDDFGKWVNYHDAAFGNIAAYFEGATNRSMTEQHWINVLRDVTLDEAKLATDIMFASEEAAPVNRSKHPAVVARIVREVVRPNATDVVQFVDGERVFSCRDCHDSGLVSVWHPRTMQDLRDGLPVDWPRDEDGNAIRATKPGQPIMVRQSSCAVVCDCEAGDRLPKRWIDGAKRAGRPTPKIPLRLHRTKMYLVNDVSIYELARSMGRTVEA